MNVLLKSIQVGPYGMNTYCMIDNHTATSVVIDPGGDPDRILEMTGETKIEKILVTHGHHDHVLALEELKSATQASVYLHPLDAAKFSIEFEHPLEDGQIIPFGKFTLKVIHVPGHTPGQCCFDLGDGRVIVGDTIFVGGPGKTNSPEDFLTTILSMQEIVFQWPDNTLFYPGHGPSGQIGIERPAFEAFLETGWPDGLHGDVTWK
jgi:hydroxyacylglutathione hydrolase